MDQQRVNEFVMRFDERYQQLVSDAERKAGRALKDWQRRQHRQQVRDEMRAEWGDILTYVDAYVKSVSDHFHKNTPRAGLPKLSSLSEEARIGGEIENRLRGLSIAANSRMRGIATTTVTARKGEAFDRYVELVNSLGTAPSDLVAAKLLGVTPTIVESMRLKLRKQGYKFKASISENGVPTQWEIEQPPAPDPSKEPSLSDLVAALDDDDKRTLYDLLKGIKR